VSGCPVFRPRHHRLQSSATEIKVNAGCFVSFQRSSHDTVCGMLWLMSLMLAQCTCQAMHCLAGLATDCRAAALLMVLLAPVNL
jgi:hypothetical protein